MNGQAPALLAEHDTIGGYVVKRRLGAGGHGAVYEVEHQLTGRRCALKALLPHLVENEETRRRFLKESRTAVMIRMPNIVDVLDAGMDERSDTPFIVMELLEGQTLAELLASGDPLPNTRMVSLLRQVAEALEAAHEQGVVHRDLKPSNLMICSGETGQELVKVFDFGIAKVLSANSQEATSQVIGTPLYMAPEQFTGAPVGPQTDVYALGMIAFEMLAGVPYYKLEREQSTNAYTLGGTIVKGPPESASARAARYGIQISAAFDGWFGCATARRSAARFSSARGAIAALQGAPVSEWAATEKASAQADAIAISSQPPLGRRRPRPLWLLLPVGVLAAAVWLMRDRAEDERESDPAATRATQRVDATESVTPSSVVVKTQSSSPSPPSSPTTHSGTRASVVTPPSAQPHQQRRAATSSRPPKRASNRPKTPASAKMKSQPVKKKEQPAKPTPEDLWTRD